MQAMIDKLGLTEIADNVVGTVLKRGAYVTDRDVSISQSVSSILSSVRFKCVMFALLSCQV